MGFEPNLESELVLGFMGAQVLGFRFMGSLVLWFTGAQEPRTTRAPQNQ
jgi:hypothetical protein